VRFLLDEDTKSALARHLSKSTHDTERVVTALEPGATDSEVMEYAHSTDRIIVTHDNDFADTDLHDEHRGVFYCPNQRLPPFEMYRIITAVIEAYPNRDAFPSVVYLTREWL
jgi:predicted nuclease of predicted toxin-antitoxin system